MPLNDEFWQKEQDLLWAAIVTIYLSTLMEGVDSGINALPEELQQLVNTDGINEQSLLQLEAFRDGVLSNIHKTTQEQVNTAFDDWVKSGAELVALVALLDVIFSDNRAEMIAITETTRAFQDGSELVWTTLEPQLSFMQINTQRDERVCPICGPKDGVIVSIHSDNRPPFHPRCRCYTSPLVKES